MGDCRTRFSCSRSPPTIWCGPKLVAARQRERDAAFYCARAGCSGGNLQARPCATGA
jgi:hypothetical protein